MFQASQEVWDETQEKMAQFVYIPTPSAVPSSYASILCFIFPRCIERLQCITTGVVFEEGNRLTKAIASQTKLVAVADSSVANKSRDRSLQDIFVTGAVKKVRINTVRLFFRQPLLFRRSLDSRLSY